MCISQNVELFLRTDTRPTDVILQHFFHVLSCVMCMFANVLLNKLQRFKICVELVLTLTGYNSMLIMAAYIPLCKHCLQGFTYCCPKYKSIKRAAIFILAGRKKKLIAKNQTKRRKNFRLIQTQIQ